jgi:general secretion pathway protein K
VSAPSPSQRGAALLTVLLLVAVMAAASAVALERLTLAARLGGSAGAMEQARFHQLAAEALAIQRIAAVAGTERTTLAGNWHGRAITVPLPQGAAMVRVTDGGNCFNINSLVAAGPNGATAVRPLAATQFTTLLIVLGVDGAAIPRIVASAIDWIDADQIPLPDGSEIAERGGASPANAPMTDTAQMATLAGMTPQIWARIAPWVCTLPTNDLSPININTLLPEQAPLLQMLVGPDLSAAAARTQLAGRPADGFMSVTSFWQSGALRAMRVPDDAAQQVRVRSRWFRLATVIRVGDVALAGSSLIDSAATPGARVVARRWEEAS